MLCSRYKKYQEHMMKIRLVNSIPLFRKSKVDDTEKKLQVLMSDCTLSRSDISNHVFWNTDKSNELLFLK